MKFDFKREQINSNSLSLKQLKFKIMKTFQEYETIALESKKLLFDAYVKEQNLEKEYQNKGGIQESIEVYKWRNSEREKLESEFKNNAHRSLFLEAWNKGNFSSCDYHLERF